MELLKKEKKDLLKRKEEMMKRPLTDNEKAALLGMKRAMKKRKLIVENKLKEEIKSNDKKINTLIKKTSKAELNNILINLRNDLK